LDVVFTGRVNEGVIHDNTASNPPFLFAETEIIRLVQQNGGSRFPRCRWEE